MPVPCAGPDFSWRIFAGYSSPMSAAHLLWGLPWQGSTGELEGLCALPVS